MDRKQFRQLKLLRGPLPKFGALLARRYPYAISNQIYGIAASLSRWDLVTPLTSLAGLTPPHGPAVLHSGHEARGQLTP